MPRSEYENDSENESENENESEFEHKTSQSGDSVDSEMIDSEMEEMEEKDYIPSKSFKETVKQIFKEATKEAATKEATDSEKLIMDLRKFYLDYEKCKDLNTIDKKIIYSICNEIMKKC